MSKQQSPVAQRRIERSITWVRGQSVMLDADLAQLYGVQTRVLVQAVKRHRNRFPVDFMFRLTKEEFDELSDGRLSSEGRGGRRYTPYAFTEQGVAMLSSVLNSPHAVDANIQIMRAFVRFRRMLASHRDLARKLAELERKYDRRFRGVFSAIRALMAEQERPRRQIGFRAEE